jgi:hypothetical protein
VPDTLCFKYLRPQSLSQTWDHTLRQRFDVLVSCMREIWLSDLSAPEKMALAEPLLLALKDVLPRAYPSA